MKPTTEVLINQMQFYVKPCASPDGDYWDTVNKGNWESETFTFLKKYIRPDKSYLELGGWIGSTALGAYAYNPKQVYAIEADPSNFQVLKHNIALNYAGDKIKAFNACLTDKANAGKVVGFGKANPNKPNSSSHRLDNGDRIKVQTTNALPFLKKNCDLKNVNCANFDIEGSEIYLGDVLKYFQGRNVAILLSLHAPFWKDKVKSASDMYSFIEKYTIIDPFTYKEIPKPTIMGKLLEDKFYSIIIESKGR